MADEWEVVSTDESGWEPVSQESGWEPASLEVPIQQRSLGERFVGNIKDAFSRSGAGQMSRSIDPDPGVFSSKDILNVQVRPGGVVDRILQGVGVNAATDELTPAQKAEKERRETYESVSSRDPLYTAPGGVPGKVAAGAATLGGQLLGTAVSPESWVSGGSNLLARMGIAGAANAGTDVLLQGGDIGAGVQDKYSPLQTVGAGVLGAGLQGGGELAARGIRDASGAMKGFGESIDRLSGYEPIAPVRRPQVSFSQVRDRLITQESGGNQKAVSPKGAFGVAQLMPGTASYVAKKMGRPELAELAKTDAKVNEQLGAAYYDEMLDRFGGDHILASAAYNAGPGRVERWVKRFGDPDVIGRQAWIDKIPIAETKGYVQNVAADFIDSPGGLPRAPELAGGPEAKPQTLADQGILTPQGLEADAQGVLRPVAEAAATPEPRIAEEPSSTVWEPISRQPVEEDIPIPAKPTEAAAVPPPAPVVPSLTDRALDVLRNGDRVRLDQGPSLVEFIAKAGGLQDAGGELRAIDADRWHRERPFMPRLVQEAGIPLDQAAVKAQEAGYLPERVGEGDMRAQPQDLVNAIQEEIAGRPMYARQDLDNAELRAQVEHMDQLLNELGLDPARMGNDEIRAYLDDFFMEPDSKVRASDDIEDLVFGLKSGTLGSTKGGLREQPKAGAVPAADPTNVKPVDASVAELAQDLKEALDLTHRQGRLAMRGAEGTYNRKSGVLRTKGMQELDVLAHEAGHQIEFTKRYPTMLQAMDAFAPDLKALSYPGAPENVSRQEGFAEFIRWYMTNPDYAKKVAPGFYEAFEQALARDDPKVLSSLRGVQSGYSTWLRSPSAAVATSMVVAPPKESAAANLGKLARTRGPMAAVSEFFAEGYRGLFDRLNPLNRAVERIQEIAGENGVRRPLKTSENPYRLMRMLPGAANAGHMDLMHGVHPYQGLEPEGPSMADALAEALGDKFFKWDDAEINRFGAYLAARRMIQEWARFGRGELEQPPDQTSAEMWAQAAADFEAANPSWKDAASKVYEWTNNLWKKRREAGLITEEQYLDGLNKADYVPVMRDISDRERPSGKRGSGTKGAGGVRRFRGSSRQIINPINTLMQQAYEVNAVIAKNDAILALRKLAEEAGPDAGGVFEVIPSKDLKAINVDAVETMRRAMDDAFLDERDAMDLETAIEAAFPGGTAPTKIFRATDTNEKGEPIIYGWDNGERFAARLPDGKWGKDMVEAFANMPPFVRSKAVDLASIPAQTLRFGVTGHPQFFIANTIRDQMTAAILTDVGYKPFVSQMKGLFSELTQDEITRVYNRMQGAIGGAQSSAANKGEGERAVQALQKRGYPIRRFHGLKGLSEFTELSETGTRLGIFKNAMERAKKEGLNDWEAAQEASFQARDYMDFDRRGGWGATQVAARVVPFFNASLQALDKSRRVAGGILKAPEVVGALFGGPPLTPADQRLFNHAMKLWTVTSAMAMMSLAIRAAYENDPEYEEVADYLRNTHWVFKLPNGDFGVVPKPFDLAMLSNVAERAYEATIENDPTAWARLKEGMEQILIPAHDAPVLGLPFQLASNRDGFGGPIVPEHLRNVEPEDQYGDRASEVSKALGDMFNISPAQIDHVLKGIGGSMARDALEAADNIINPDAPKEGRLPDTFVAGRFIKDWTRGAVSGKEFWKLISDNGGKYAAGEGSVRKLMMDDDIPGAVKKLDKMDPQARAYTLSNMFLDGDWKLAHPLIRTAREVGVISDLMSDIQEGNIIGADGQVVPLTKEERTEALTNLSRLSVAAKRNALIDTGVKGWVEKAPMDRDEYLAKIPEPIQNALQLRLSVEFKDPRMADPDTWEGTWARLRPQLEGKPNQAAISQMMEQKRTKGRAGAERILREITPAQ